MPRSNFVQKTLAAQSFFCGDAREKAEQVADWMTELLEWTAETRMAELELYKRSNVEIQVARPP